MARFDLAGMTVKGYKDGHEVTEPASKTFWFTCPVGTFETYGEAAMACERCDMMPELCIRPVPVMVGQSLGVYEILL